MRDTNDKLAAGCDLVANDPLTTQRLALAIHAGAVGVWEWDTRTDLVTLYHDLFELPNRRANEPIGLALLLEYINAKDRPSVRRALELSRATDEPVNVEFRVNASQRDGRWLILRGQRAQGAGNATISGAMIDASEQRHAELRRALQQEVLVGLAKNPDVTDARIIQALEVITRIAAKTLNVSRCGVWLFNHDHSELRCEMLCESESAGEERMTQGVVLSAAQYPRYFRAAEIARVLNAADAHSDPRTAEYEESYLIPLGIDSMLDAPIRREGRVVGVICNESINGRRTWTPDEQAFAASLGDLVGTILETADRRIFQSALADSMRHTHAQRAAGQDMVWRAKVDPPVSVHAPDAEQVAQVIARSKLVSLSMPNDPTRSVDLQQFIGHGPAEFVDRDLLERELAEWVRARYFLVDREVQTRLLPSGDDNVWMSHSFFGVVERGYLVEIWGMQCQAGAKHDVQRALMRRATHDGLTGLPNRGQFLTSFREQIQAASLSNSCATFLVDLDHFKELNDTLGHAAGDVLLHGVAPRLRPLLGRRPGALIARLGSDEFALLVPGISQLDAQALAAEIVAALHQPFLIRGLEIEMGGSLGWVISPQQGSDPEELLRRADVAMYAAKRDRVGHCQYAMDFDGHTHRRFTLMTQICAAIPRNEMFVEMQPIVSAVGEHLLGFESLVRWQHPSFGRVVPGEFIRLAEMTRSIEALTQFVVNDSLRIAKKLHFAATNLTVSINLSPNLLRGFDFEFLLAAAAANGIAPAQITLEVTETDVLVDSPRALETLRALRAAGFRLAIDDFGTGYSSLHLLRALEVDFIKIDPGFVAHLQSRPRDREIVRATINLARSLGVQVIAEGVEDRGVFEALLEAGCDAVQGYDIARPMGEIALAQWLIARRASEMTQSPD